MTYAINLRKAQQLMGGMEMYARINRFTAEHNAFMAEPSSHRFSTLSDRVRAGHKTVREDGLVMWVYEFYMYLHNDTDYNGDTRLNDLCIAMRELNDYRFPRPKDATYMQALHLQRMERLLSPRYIAGHYANALRGREWHYREQNAGDIHEAVFRAWEITKPADTDQLMMEWPRISKQGHHMVAYTRDEKYGEADRQLVTSVSKYLSRHFPALLSSTIRDIAALYCEAKIQITHDHDKMLEIIKNGPGSCMSGDDRFACGDHHPYEVYDPKFGWHMAYITEGDTFTGRALLNEKTFVRTYRGNAKQSSYSDTDERLNAWLREQGYSRASDWEGFKLAKIEVRNNCGFVAPYLDGCSKDVDVYRDHLLVVGSDDGEYTCNCTDGDAAEQASSSCEDCDSRMSEDDTYRVYRDGSRCVCASCYEHNYTVVIGRRGDRYAVDNDDAIEVGDECYHTEWLSDNGIVVLHDGDYSHEDDAVYIASCGEYYPSESDYICYTKAGEYELLDDCVELADGEWCLSDDAWCCDHSGDYYENDVDSVVTKCGKRVHEDYADEYETAETDTGEQPVQTALEFLAQAE